MNSEKQELLESFQEVESKQKELGLKDLLISLLVIAIVYLLIFPKIYLSNQIYYKSRHINKLLDDYEILKEENRLLRQKIDALRYKNQILDTIF